MRLTEQQQRLVEENTGLVGKVIKDRVRGANGVGIYTYDDLYQIGCVGLCKAAATAKPVNTHFSTYAYLLIRNEIYTALEYATLRRQREFSAAPEEMSAQQCQEQMELPSDLPQIMEKVAQRHGGVIAKGVRVIQLMEQGYSCKDIGLRMDAKANQIAAWASKARQVLRSDSDILKLREA